VSGKRGREVFLNGDPEHGVSDFSISEKYNPDTETIRSGLLAK
jgi:hypothetical protein